MKHVKLKKSPLTYVLAQVKISAIENIKNYVPEIQDRIRKEGFPIYNDINLQTIEFRNDANPNISSTVRWHFKDEKSEIGIFLDKQAITIHTSNYNNFDMFISKIEKILDIFHESIDIGLSTRIALRYINVIQTNIEKYVNSQLLGFHNKQDKKFLSTLETHYNNDKKRAIIRSIYNKNFIDLEQNKLVPPDLISGAEYLSFKHTKQPKICYVMIDLDHFSQKQSKFKTKNTIKEFGILHDKIYELFCRTVTPDALKAWG